MNELNNDWVLWGSILALVLSIVSFAAFAYKTTRAMEGLEEDEGESEELDLKK